jgi:NAD(P)-dependent dehydrogenase (short-subunit alcohol dehydrogenase family)
MARVFITGSSDGLGRRAAQLLIEQGHRLVLHARNEQRGEQAHAAVPGAQTAVIGDPRLMTVNRMGVPTGSEQFTGTYYGHTTVVSGVPGHWDVLSGSPPSLAAPFLPVGNCGPEL